MSPLRLLVLAAFCAVSIFAARADAALVGTPGYAPTNFGPTFGPGDYSLGFEFSVNTNLSVTALGFIDQGNNGLAESHEVAIYYAQTFGAFVAGNLVPGAIATVVPADSAGGTLTIPSAAPGSTDRSYAYHMLTTPVELFTGVNYRIAAHVSTLEGYAFNSNGGSTSSVITFGQGKLVSDGTPDVQYPTGTDTFNIYSNPNFLYVVPEPSTLMLLAAALPMFAAGRRRSSTSLSK